MVRTTRESLAAWKPRTVGTSLLFFSVSMTVSIPATTSVLGGVVSTNVFLLVCILLAVVDFGSARSAQLPFCPGAAAQLQSNLLELQLLVVC